ncbi:MAG TPA: pyridoxamine 5'-phosphate oxidase family protein [Kofleriaceae bacterium]|nr:pyridoxamine 5'-phosphate oxidase family protein [Kofleriaceae bacterium]
MQAATKILDHTDLRERVLAYLARHTTLNLATYGPAGLWAAAVLYVPDGTNLYFTSVAATRHGQNMVATGRVAGTINDDCTDWGTAKGLQLEGRVVLVDNPEERLHVVEDYLFRFPFSTALWHGESNAQVIARDPGIHGFYRIEPSRLFFMDNEHAMGKREELALG